MIYFARITTILTSLLLLMALLSPPPVLSKDFENIDHLKEEFPDWFSENAFSDLSEELSDSADNNKKGLMVLFTTQGCSYCKVFIHKSLGDPLLAKKVQQHFTSIGMEIFDDAEMTSPDGETLAIKQFALNQGVEFAPTLLFFNNEGKRIVHAVGYQTPQRFDKILDYIADDHVKHESLQAYFERINQQQNTVKLAMRNDPLFSSPPYALDRSHFAADEPLLVIFEKPDCKTCNEFHDHVLAVKEVRDLLKNFEVVRLNASDTKTPILAPDGSKTNPANWYQKTQYSRLPALLFFNEQGKQVVGTDALVMEGRMKNAINLVLERAYEKGWNYQRFARTKGIERNQREAELAQKTITPKTAQ